MNNKIRRTLLTFICIPNLLFGQQVMQSKPESLEKIFNLQYQQDRAKAEKISLEKNIPLRIVDKTGNIREFAGFDKLGKMMFNVTDNIGAGRTISTNKVWPGGTVGTSLTGILSGPLLPASSAVCMVNPFKVEARIKEFFRLK